MIESARASVEGIFGLSLAFWLTDGGSQDGTIEWCLSQPDINLIQHGQLLGAIRAFNDASYAAQADYIILANDDIEFVTDSILLAYTYMQSNPDCGVGCFYQNRNGQDWHVEQMPCVYEGKQVHRPYGQVCIVPKWLGDKVGWWGDWGGHTYGGDNELSAQMYELGFQVSPIPGAKISDHEVQDDLRKVNNITGGKDPRAVGGHHPDSWTWGRKWKHFDLPGSPVGPIIRPYPMLTNPIVAKERVLYLPIYEQGWAIQKEQKRGLREALAKVALTVEYDYLEQYAKLGEIGMLGEIEELMAKIQPTIFLSQLHNGEQINAADIARLKQDNPKTRFINWNGDFWPENLLSEDGIKLAKAFDLQLGVNRDAIEKQKAMDVNAGYWQIGYEPDGVGYEGGMPFDVVFLASGYSPARQVLVKKLKSLNLSFGLYGNGWPAEWSQGQTMYNFSEGCKIYRAAKIGIGDSQWPDTGFVSNRVFQILAAGGCAMAHQWFRDMDKLGLVDGETCIIWKDFSELEKKIKYYLNHEKERAAIALAGERLALREHSFEARASELLAMIEPQKAEDNWRW
jgi:hypothetical protein